MKKAMTKTREPQKGKREKSENRRTKRKLLRKHLLQTKEKLNCMILVILMVSERGAYTAGLKGSAKDSSRQLKKKLKKEVSHKNWRDRRVD
jgi:hypothetical protein